MKTYSYSGSDTSNGPLAGIRVLDLSMLLPGPLCSMHLADLGAEVIKVEHPVAIDGTRRTGPGLRGSGGETNAYFYVVNRNKKAITLNYKRPEGQELLLKLLETADVLIEGFRPKMMDDLGLGYTVLKERFPRLIYCAISGYGATGPDHDKAGHDANYLADTGVLHITGTEEDPVLLGIQVADIAGGTLLALSGILAALEGQFFQVFLRQIGREELLKQTADGDYEGVRTELAAFFAEKTYADLQPIFDHTDTCLSPILTIEEAFANPQLHDRNAIVELEDRRLGKIRVPGSPFHLKETPVSYRLAPPDVGEHNAAIYGEPGLDAARLEELKKKRIL